MDHYLVLIPYTEEYGHEAQIRRFRDFEENEGVEIAKMQPLFPKTKVNFLGEIEVAIVRKDECKLLLSHASAGPLFEEKMDTIN